MVEVIVDGERGKTFGKGIALILAACESLGKYVRWTAAKEISAEREGCDVTFLHGKAHFNGAA